MSTTATSPRQRALIFRLPGEESARNALKLADTARQAGMDVEMAPYWPDSQPVWPAEAPLLHQDIGSAPRLSRFALMRRYGLDLDLLELQAHNLATEPITPDLILPESVWHQRLRGVAAIILERLEQYKPDILFVAHGAEVVSRIITEVAAFRKVPVLFWESGFFPGYLYLDPHAPHFFRGLNASDQKPLAATPSQKTRDFISRWQAEGQSKYTQSSTDLQRFVDWKGADQRPILFVAGQISSDANAAVGLGRHRSLHALYRAVLKVPKGWRLVFKPHPKRPDDIPDLGHIHSADVFIGDIPLQEALGSAQAVMVHSSNVGLEALMLGKPTLITGRPVFSGRKLCMKVSSADDLRRYLSGNLLPPPAKGTAAMVQNILDFSLLADGDSETLAKRVVSATVPAQRRKLLRYYGHEVRLLVAALNLLYSRLKSTPRLMEAIQALSPRSRQIIARHISFDGLVPHVYAGAELPISVVAPHPIRGTRRPKHKTLPVRLEECAFPISYLRQHMKLPQLTYSVACRLASGEEEASAQCFTRADIEWMAQRLGRSVEIVSEDNAPEGTSYLATLFFRPKTMATTSFRSTEYANWFIPPEAFSMSTPVQWSKSGHPVLCGKHVHAIYGPYLHIPEGRWQVSWAPHPLDLVERMRFWFFKALRSNLRMEITAQQDGSVSEIKSVAFSKMSTELVSTAGSIYEFRTNWSGPTRFPITRSPKFSGLVMKYKSQ